MARFFAAVVDMIVFLPLAFLDEALLAPEQPSAVILAWAAVSYSSYWIYSVLLHARYGQTIGKRLLRVRVLDVGELRTPTLGQALLRDIGIVVFDSLALLYLIYLLITASYSPSAMAESPAGTFIAWAALVWLALELITMLSNEKRRAFHDLIAGTVVVRAA